MCVELYYMQLSIVLLGGLSSWSDLVSGLQTNPSRPAADQRLRWRDE